MTGTAFPAQVPTLGRQVQRAVSMAALAAVCEVCEALDQTPELQLDPPDAVPTEQLLAALPLNQRLQKPQLEEQSRCVPWEGSVSARHPAARVGNPCLLQGIARCCTGFRDSEWGLRSGGSHVPRVHLRYGHP